MKQIDITCYRRGNKIPWVFHFDFEKARFDYLIHRYGEFPGWFLTVKAFEVYDERLYTNDFEDACKLAKERVKKMVEKELKKWQTIKDELEED